MLALLVSASLPLLTHTHTQRHTYTHAHMQLALCLSIASFSFSLTHFDRSKDGRSFTLAFFHPLLSTPSSPGPKCNGSFLFHLCQLGIKRTRRLFRYSEKKRERRERADEKNTFCSISFFPLSLSLSLPLATVPSASAYLPALRGALSAGSAA